ncbi:hypothetical protein BJ684DRAFT_17509 [Piptocephalis cylindrospora]|uniref:Uncharacterized protein n=1 Tax=Piptocephalis cylindrospora TaxID=1907219 RepID=A0A4P9XZN5_9FUNG|nr:hypothetical protein BJ684DRAFT_17509 [Piptocephalis cylindrospora]|eukprot:RKP11958.1 hypothetical protein BJ684DRAFT_17509 [Piptocephalis cylindrospora]
MSPLPSDSFSGNPGILVVSGQLSEALAVNTSQIHRASSGYQGATVLGHSHGPGEGHAFSPILILLLIALLLVVVTLVALVISLRRKLRDHSHQGRFDRRASESSRSLLMGQSMAEAPFTGSRAGNGTIFARATDDVTRRGSGVSLSIIQAVRRPSAQLQRVA